jgi:hypothetical protein
LVEAAGEVEHAKGQRGLLMHVGADTSSNDTLGIVGPVFPDNNEFEFLPIVEINPGRVNLAYTVIRGVSSVSRRCERFLSFYVGSSLQDRLCHYDPNPEGFTYSEPLDSRRGKQLIRLQPDDFLFFVASLAPYSEDSYHGGDSARIRRGQAGQMSKISYWIFSHQRCFIS